MTDKHPASTPLRTPLWVLATLAIVAALVLSRPLLIPVALSLYAAVLLLPPVEYLCRLGMSRLAAAGCVMLLLAGGMAAIVDMTLAPAREWIDRAPAILSQVERKIRPLHRTAVQLDKVAEHAERIAGAAAGAVTGAAPAGSTPAATHAGSGLLRKTSAILVPVIAAFFLTFFVLACGPPLLQRVAQTRADSASARRLLITVERARRDMGRYLGTLALINLGLGSATAALAMAFDLPNPVLWGVMAGVFNFVPYAGSAANLIVLTLVALLTHDGFGPAIGIALSYLLLDTIEGQLIQPLAIGHRLALNPLAIFLALWIGAGLWGIAGMLLATPVLLTVKIICRHVPRCRVLSQFLTPVRERPMALRARSWRRQRRRARGMSTKAHIKS